MRGREGSIEVRTGRRWVGVDGDVRRVHHARQVERASATEQACLPARRSWRCSASGARGGGSSGGRGSGVCCRSASRGRAPHGRAAHLRCTRAHRPRLTPSARRAPIVVGDSSRARARPVDPQLLHAPGPHDPKQLEWHIECGIATSFPILIICGCICTCNSNINSGIIIIMSNITSIIISTCVRACTCIGRLLGLYMCLLPMNPRTRSRAGS